MANTLLPPGATAPDFALKATPDQRVTLGDLRGRPLVIAFYPADWSPVCGDQMVLYNEVQGEFRRYGAQIIGISCDGPWCHLAFAKDRRIAFPLLSDFEPKGAASRAYGAYDEREGVSQRALFVVDEAGRIAWRYLSPLGVNPGADGILDALERLDASRRRGVEGAPVGEVHP